ncbi:NAD(P)-dependent oxidoreductase [Roseomonas terrae]|jgi:2-hydroxy-3-oxopropionate reductase|uniref:NAD(P)-dependent oxidoreductase n=1 Tax=Neoroseomonas terrae TaxID=424799 RepID=A0ABS5EPK5_9PROT|nr:NAD(P)-dependent oxidoreductase [Neoroseomonas terrae]MBR0652963.1 NAD(P)-dependent oxidoreductase [Neoroseomonas terrae]
MTPVIPPARVAFIGMGVMGAAMAANIMKAGFALTVSSRSRAKAEPLIAAGADWAPTAQDAADGAACVCLCVPDTPDVEAVLFGEDGVIHGAAPGTVVIDFSTIAASASAGFAARMAERGLVLLDSPVSGGPQGAIDGTLTCMVGGADAGFSAARQVFDAVGKTITLLGPAGSGQVCKSANQLIIVAAMQAAAEALAMGRKAGLDPMLMRQALLGGSARSFVMENHAKRMIEGTFKPGFRAELMRKDIRLAVGAMRDNGVFAPATALGAQMMEAVVNSGRGGLDAASLYGLVAELSGLKD